MLLIGPMLALAAPLGAQDSAAPASGDPLVDVPAEPDPNSADAVVAAARDKLRPPSVPKPCPPPTAGGEIVVCGRTDDSANRVPSSTDDAYAAGQSVSDGLPRAPDVFGIPQGGVNIRIGNPPPQPYIIDLKSIPEAPAGSDAARYQDDPGQQSGDSPGADGSGD